MLEVKELHVSFRSYLGLVEAVRGVSFSVAPGETVAIVGESGSGKSVTAQAIMQLTPPLTSQIEGAVYFEDEDLLKKSKRAMRKIRGQKMGMIFQDPMTSLNPTMRIGKQIREAGVSPEEALELLELVEISNPEKRLQQYPHELSGGMRQRVMIAIALACNPKLLIADEPTTALDVTIQAQILKLIQRIQKERNMGMILITHDLGVVAGNCDRVLVLYGGRIVESGTVEQIFDAPAHPYTQGLLRSVPRLDMDPRKILEPIEGTPPSLLKPPQGCAFCARCTKAMRICQGQQPAPVKVGNGHYFACWEGHE